MADQVDKLLAHLDRFIIMDDVELAPVEAETAIGADWSEGRRGSGPPGRLPMMPRGDDPGVGEI